LKQNLESILHFEISHYKSEISSSDYRKLINSFTACLVAVFIYPFNHIYTYHSSIDNIPRFLDNIFSVIVLLLALLFIIFFIKNDFNKIHKNSAIIIIFFVAFILMSMGWILIYRFLGYDLIASNELFKYYSKSILYYILLFFTGFYFKAERWGSVFILLFFVIFINTIMHINPNNLMIDLREIVNPDYKGIYLGLSTTTLFTGLLAWASSRKELTRILIMLIMGILLFVMGSRADFVSFLIVLPVLLWFSARLLWRIFTYLSLGLIGFVGFMIVGIDKLTSSRQSQLFNFENFTSFIGRYEQFKYGLEKLSESPLTGNYGGTLIDYGSLGNYIHNILSVWQAFGIITFLIYGFLILIIVMFSIKMIKCKGRNMEQHLQLICILSFMIFIQVIFAKSLGWQHPALVWGLVAGWWQNNKNRKKHNKIVSDIVN
jgi:hypothetical protein